MLVDLGIFDADALWHYFTLEALENLASNSTTCYGETIVSPAFEGRYFVKAPEHYASELRGGLWAIVWHLTYADYVGLPEATQRVYVARRAFDAALISFSVGDYADMFECYCGVLDTLRPGSSYYNRLHLWASTLALELGTGWCQYFHRRVADIVSRAKGE